MKTISCQKKWQTGETPANHYTASQLHWIKIGVTNFETHPSIALVSLKILQTIVSIMDAYEDDAPKTNFKNC